jgi:hypothetical protein
VTCIKWKLVSVYLEIVLIKAQERCTVIYVKWKLVSDCLEIVLISMEDRCTVCVECTTGMEIFLAHPMVLLGDVGRVEARFDPFGDSINLEAR